MGSRYSAKLVHASPHGGLTHGLTHHDWLPAPRIHHEVSRGWLLLLKWSHPELTLLCRLLVETPGAIAPYQWNAMRILLPLKLGARWLDLGSQELVRDVVC